MSIHKEKATLFANIFKKLDDSDSESDDESVDDGGVVRKDTNDNKHVNSSQPEKDQSQITKPPKLTIKERELGGDSKANDTATQEDVIVISSDDSNSRDLTCPQTKTVNLFYDIDSGSSDDVVLVEPTVVDSSQLTNNEDEASADTSFFEDYNFNLKLNRCGRYERYTMMYKSKICDTLKDLIDELARSNKSLVLTRDGESVPLDSSPHSLALTPGEVLDAIEVQPDRLNTSPDLVTEPIHMGDKTSSTQQNGDPNKITLKLQDGNRKHSKEILVALDEPLSRLKQEYAVEFGLDLATVKLSFDGDIVGDQDTASSLDMEDGCVLDVLYPQEMKYISPIDLTSPVRVTRSTRRRNSRYVRRQR